MDNPSSRSVLDQLPANIRRQLSDPGPQVAVGEHRHRFRRTVPEDVRRRLDAPDDEPLDVDTAPGPRWCMVECEEGEFPVVRVFGDLNAMVRRIAELEGQEVAVCPYYGRPVAMSTGPRRLLFLPDGRVVSVDGRPVPDNLTADVVVLQDDGNLGVGDVEIETSWGAEVEETRGSAQPDDPDDGDDPDDLEHQPVAPK